MNGKNFDVFISYRRSDGTDKARILDLAFSIDDCRTFLDFKSLGVGVFDKRLEDAVLDAPIFVMVLTPDYFARCNEEGDWVRKEIELALDNNKIIIPINYDGKVNCPPDYLDEEFKSRVGCHNFKALHRDSSFDATVKSIFDLHIRPYLSTHSNNEGKAKVSVKADADCELLLDDEIIATVQKDKTKQVFVERGEHFFTARSTEFPQIEEEIEKTIDDLSFKYSLRIKIEDKVQSLREEKRKKKTLTGHFYKVNSIATSPDGKYLASGSMDKTVIIRNAYTRHIIRKLNGHSLSVISVSWSPDGRYLASGSDDKTVIIWDASSGEKLKTLEGHSNCVSSVSWSPDGKYLASGSWDNTIIIWDAESGKILKTLEGHSWIVTSVSWSPDGMYLASGSSQLNGDIRIGMLFIWDAKSGKILKTLDGHSDLVWSVSWSPNGMYLASGGYDNIVIIWNAKSGKILKILERHSDNVSSVSWSPDGKYLASGSKDETVIIWDAKSGEILKTLEGHSDGVLSVCWSPDGKYLVSGSRDETVIIWGVD